MCLLFYRIIDIKILSCCGIFMDLIFITKPHKLIFRIIRPDAVCPCVYYRNIFLACVTLCPKTSNYLKISSHTPSKGLTCHHLFGRSLQLGVCMYPYPEYCDKSPRCDQISHHTSHITCHTQHKVFRCKEEPRLVNQSAFQISTLAVYLGIMYNAEMSSDIPQLF